MTQPSNAGSLEAWVAADKGGSSGPPGGAQAPVAAASGDLRGRFEEASEAYLDALAEFDAAKFALACARRDWDKAKRQYDASQTPVGGNAELRDRPVSGASPKPQGI